MAFPSASLTPPALSPYQFSYLGYTFAGPSDPLQLSKIEGLDLANVRTGDTGRGRDAGRFIGLDLLDGRDITVTGDVILSPSNWKALANAIVAGGVTESPLWHNLPGWGMLGLMMRARKHNMPIDIQAALGNLASITIQFSGADPRIYAAPTLSASAGLPVPHAGFGFPLLFPLAFGGGTTVGSIVATNSGNMDCRPLLTVTGPCTNPSVQNSSAPGAPYLTFALSMATGDRLVIDTDLHTATYFVAGTSIGASRAALLTQGSQWFSLLPANGLNAIAGGVNYLSFSSQDQTAVSGTLTVNYAPAWIL
jgi:hypothetical protein